MKIVKLLFFGLLLLSFHTHAATPQENQELQQGQKIYEKACITCHAPDKAPLMKSPAIHDQAAWGPRLQAAEQAAKANPSLYKTKYDYLVSVVKQGKNAMVPGGMCVDQTTADKKCKDADYIAAIKFMSGPAANAAPKAPAPSAPAAPATPQKTTAVAVPTQAKVVEIAGPEIANQCAACHGPAGNSVTEQWPKLAGQNEKYFIKQMLDFKNEKSGRISPIMHSIDATLTMPQIETLATYFSNQKTSPGFAKPQYVEVGQQIYHGGLLGKGVPACSACHGPKGEGNAEAGFALLSGQEAEYVTTQLKAFRSGERSNDQNHIMRDIAANMNNEDINAVASYISGLH